MRYQVNYYYAENRRIKDPLVLKTVANMRENGASAKGILSYLRKRTGKRTALRDVHNMLQAIRSNKRGDTPDAVRAEYVLREFVSQELENAASIFVEDETQLAHVVVFQSARMKRLFQAFPDVVLVDTTHGTNANQYKLFSFVMTDFFGEGQYVQHALVKAETKDNLRLAIKFQSNNPSWNKVKVFVTDKDFHEKAVLAEAFPGTRQLLCTFHVVTWLEKQVVRLSTSHKNKLKAAISALVSSSSEEEYERGKKYFLKLLDDNEDHDLYRYFLKNWDRSRAEWVLYERGNVPHLGNHTNNRLESKWGKMKQVVSRDDSIDELISTLMLLQEVAEDDYLREYHRVGSSLQHDENSELDALAMNLSPFAYDLVVGEFKYAASGRADYDMHKTTTAVNLISRRTSTTHVVDTKSNCCDCIFMQTQLLPCRHIMFVRLQNLNETVLPPYNCIARRWMRGCPVNNIASGNVSDGGVSLQSLPRLIQPRALRDDDKYMAAKHRMENIVSVLTVQSTPTFKAALKFLDGFTKALHEVTQTTLAETTTTLAGLTTSLHQSSSIPHAQPPVSMAQRPIQQTDKPRLVAESANFAFAAPPKSPGLSRKQQRQLERATKIREARVEAKRHAEKAKPVTFEDMQKLLADTYSWSSIKAAMDDFSLKICDVRGPVEIRLLQPCQTRPEVTRMLPLEKIEEAKASIPYDIEDSRTYLAFYEGFGYITEEQLLIMERIFTVKNLLRDIGFVLDWIEVVTWNEAQLQRVKVPFGDELMLSKADRKGALTSMSLGTKYVDAEATSCASLLVYREDLWLNLTCMITGMLFLRHGYPGVGVVNPSFYHEKQPADMIRIASAFKPFEASNRRVIGVLNVTGAHWIAFMINLDTHMYHTFDPQQGNVKKMTNALRETIEPLLHMKIPRSYDVTGVTRTIAKRKRNTLTTTDAWRLCCS